MAREPQVLRKFFRRDPAHVRLWFGHFSMGGIAEFQHGAAALARYALLKRDEVLEGRVQRGSREGKMSPGFCSCVGCRTTSV